MPLRVARKLLGETDQFPALMGCLTLWTVHLRT
jgi:hypothetical protein